MGDPAKVYEISSFSEFPHDIHSATEELAGVMSAEDKIKLDNLTPGGSGYDYEGSETFSIDGPTEVLVVLPVVYPGAYRIWLTAGRSGPRVAQGEAIIPNFWIVDGGSFYIEVNGPFTGTVTWGTKGTL